MYSNKPWKYRQQNHEQVDLYCQIQTLQDATSWRLRLCISDHIILSRLCERHYQLSRHDEYLTGNYPLQIEVQSCPAGERLRAKTERGTFRFDSVVDKSGSSKPLVRLDCVRRLYDTAHQTVHCLAGVHRELSPTHRLQLAFHFIAIAKSQCIKLTWIRSLICDYM